MEVSINPAWEDFLAPLLNQQSFVKTVQILEGYQQEDLVFYPLEHQLFNAFNYCPPNDIKVVIIGQDPYHAPNQANGLCFSVDKGISLPPSLKNIFKELSSDIGVKIPPHGNLISWAKEGVLLLNSVLTVFPSIPGSHQHLGWELFTDGVIKVLSNKSDHIVFLLWGSYACKKSVLIDESKHLLLKSVHPSPLSAYRGFFGNRHFSKSNAYLVEHGKQPVDWEIK